MSAKKGTFAEWRAAYSESLRKAREDRAKMAAKLVRANAEIKRLRKLFLSVGVAAGGKGDQLILRIVNEALAQGEGE